MQRAGTVVVLAAGQGTRMRSGGAKVLHPLCGRAMLGYVLDLARALDPERILVVVGHGADEVQGWIERERLATKLVMQVHDELVLEVPAGELESVKANVEKLMMGVAKLDVPLVVEAGVGDNWEKAH